MIFERWKACMKTGIMMGARRYMVRNGKEVLNVKTKKETKL